MSSKYSSGNMEFEFRTAPAPASMEDREEPPFCIAVLGDFSGRENRKICQANLDLSARERLAVDVDNFETLAGKLGATIFVPVGPPDGPVVEIRFSNVDDFHPDQIFNRLEIFQRLKDLRKRLQDSTTFEAAATEVRSWTVAPPADKTPSQPQTPADSTKPPESDADTLERLLGKKTTDDAPAERPRQNVNMDSLIHEMVKPYIVPSADPNQAELIAQVDNAISGQMRNILHHPDFRDLEAAWRGLQFLVSRVETNETLKLFIVDITKTELNTDLGSNESLTSTGTYKFFVDQSVGIPGADPWTLMLGMFTFDKTQEDITLLRHLAQIAQAAGAPLITGAHSHFVGCDSIAGTPDPTNWHEAEEPAVNKLWQEFRSSPEAGFIGLTAPRFMLRLPYGAATDSVDMFDFEEISPQNHHENYLWGSSAVVCGCLLAEAFSQYGWNLTRGLQTEISGLPMHVVDIDGANQVVPCAETYLTDKAQDILLDRGLIPLLSIKGRDAIRIGRYQSIRQPPAPLAGRWK